MFVDVIIDSMIEYELKFRSRICFFYLQFRNKIDDDVAKRKN